MFLQTAKREFLDQDELDKVYKKKFKSFVKKLVARSGQVCKLGFHFKCPIDTYKNITTIALIFPYACEGTSAGNTGLCEGLI